MPIIIYLGCFLFKGKSRWHVLVLLIMNFGLFVYLYITFAQVRPVYDIPDVMKTTIVIFSSFVMVRGHEP